MMQTVVRVRLLVLVLLYCASAWRTRCPASRRRVSPSRLWAADDAPLVQVSGTDAGALALALRGISSSNLNGPVLNLKRLATNAEDIPLQLHELALLSSTLEEFIPQMNVFQVADSIWSVGTTVQTSLLSKKKMSPFDPSSPSAIQRLQLLSTTVPPIVISRLLKLNLAYETGERIEGIPPNKDMSGEGKGRIILSRNLAMTLTGLVRLNASYSTLNLHQREQLHELLLISLPGLTGKEGRTLANTVWCLGRLGVPLGPGSSDKPQSALLAPLLDKILLELAESSPTVDQTLSTLLVGLHSAGVTWADLPVPLQSALCRSYCRVCTRISSRALGNILWTLGRMGLAHAGMTERVAMATELGVRAAASGGMKNRDAVQIIQGLVAVHYRWNYLSMETRERLAGSIYTSLAAQWASQGEACLVPLSTLFFSLSRMGVRWSEVEKHRGLKASLLVGVKAAAGQLASETGVKLSSVESRNAYTRARARERETISSPDPSSMLDAGMSSDSAELSRGISSLLYSFSLLGTPLSGLASTTRLSLFSILKRRLANSLGCDLELGPEGIDAAKSSKGDGSMSGLSLSLAVYSLGKMGARFETLPQPLAALLLKAIEREVAALLLRELASSESSVSLIDACNLLEGLGVLTSPSSRTDSDDSEVPSLASRVMSGKRGRIDNSPSVNGLGSGGSISHQLVKSVTELLAALLKGLQRQQSGHGNLQPAFSVPLAGRNTNTAKKEKGEAEGESSYVERCGALLRACISLGVSWGEVSDADTARSIMKSMTRARIGTERTFGLSLGAQEEASDSLPPVTWRGSFEEHDYRSVLVLRHLARMGVRCDDVGDDLSLFVASLDHKDCEASLSPQGLSMLLQSLASMRASVSPGPGGLSKAAKDVLLRRYYAIGTGGWAAASESALSSRFLSTGSSQRSGHEEVTSFECCLLLYGLGKLGYTFADLNEKGYLVDTLVSLLPSHTPRRLPITLTALSYMKTPSWEELPSSLHIAVCSAVGAAADPSWAEGDTRGSNSRLTSQGATCIVRFVYTLLGGSTSQRGENIGTSSSAPLADVLKMQLRRSVLRVATLFLPSHHGSSLSSDAGDQDYPSSFDSYSQGFQTLQGLGYKDKEQYSGFDDVVDDEGNVVRNDEDAVYGKIDRALSAAIEADTTLGALRTYSSREGQAVEKMLIELGLLGELTLDQRQALRAVAWTGGDKKRGAKRQGDGVSGGISGSTSVIDVTAREYNIVVTEFGDEVLEERGKEIRASPVASGSSSLSSVKYEERAALLARALKDKLGVEWSWTSETQRRDTVLSLSEILGDEDGHNAFVSNNIEGTLVVLHTLSLLNLGWGDLPTRPRNKLALLLARELQAVSKQSAGFDGGPVLSRLQLAISRIGLRRAEIPLELRDALTHLDVRF